MSTSQRPPAPYYGHGESVPEGIVHGQKHLKLMQLNYKRNCESDYTDELVQRQQEFDFEADSGYFWQDPEFSLLYGSPVWEQASEDQQRALNQLYWTCFYNYSIGGEVSTMVYNQLTCGALYPLGGYETICRELDLETAQERDHVDAFRRVGHETETALLGETIFQRPIPHYLEAAMIHPQRGRTWTRLLRNVPMMIYCGGIGYSPFMATQYYVLRGIRNIQLKVKEYQHSQRAKRLKDNREYVPAATDISHYHYLDEAFHTATSQIICHEMYRDFKRPGRVELAFTNSTVARLQTTLQNLSCAVPGIFSRDAEYMPLMYRMLQSRPFGLTPAAALEMVERCFCQEHDGFHAAAKYHARALDDARQYVADLEWLWPSNRELAKMGTASVAKALDGNRRAFGRFRRTARTERKKSGAPVAAAGIVL